MQHWLTISVSNTEICYRDSAIHVESRSTLCFLIHCHKYYIAIQLQPSILHMFFILNMLQKLFPTWICFFLVNTWVSTICSFLSSSSWRINHNEHVFVYCFQFYFRRNNANSSLNHEGVQVHKSIYLVILKVTSYFKATNKINLQS